MLIFFQFWITWARSTTFASNVQEFDPMQVLDGWEQHGAVWWPKIVHDTCLCWPLPRRFRRPICSRSGLTCLCRGTRRCWASGPSDTNDVTYATCLGRSSSDLLLECGHRSVPTNRNTNQVLIDDDLKPQQSMRLSIEWTLVCFTSRRSDRSVRNQSSSRVDIRPVLTVIHKTPW